MFCLLKPSCEINPRSQRQAPRLKARSEQPRLMLMRRRQVVFEGRQKQPGGEHNPSGLMPVCDLRPEASDWN